MGKGYILINRQLEDHWLWTDKPFSRGQAWIDLILMANYADSTMVVKGKIVEIKRGQVLRTIAFLSEKWGWNAKKVRTFVKTLEGQQMVTLQGSAQGTLITIENYAFWQTLGQESGQQKGQQKGQARGHKRNKNKEFKNNNNNSPRPPSLTEVKNYVEEKGYEMDTEAFYDYYTEVGWIKKNGQAIQDWKATVRSWERRSKEWASKNDTSSRPEYKPYKHEEYKSEPMPDYLRDKLKRGGKR